MPLVGYRQYALTKQSTTRLVKGHIFEEGADRGKAGIACARTVASGPFKISEKRPNEGSIKVFELELRRGFLKAFSGKAEQQPERVAVSGDGIGAGSSLLKQTVSEKGLQESREAGGDHVGSSW